MATLAGVFGLVCLALQAGCCGIGNGQLLSRLGFGPCCDCCPTGGCGPECPACGSAIGPGNTIPPLAPPGAPPPVAVDPNRLVPQATPIPAGPTSRSR
jgi:hypothetical protein